MGARGEGHPRRGLPFPFRRPGGRPSYRGCSYRGALYEGVPREALYGRGPKEHRVRKEHSPSYPTPCAVADAHGYAHRTPRAPTHPQRTHWGTLTSTHHEQTRRPPRTPTQYPREYSELALAITHAQGLVSSTHFTVIPRGHEPCPRYPAPAQAQAQGEAQAPAPLSVHSRENQTSQCSLTREQRGGPRVRAKTPSEFSRRGPAPRNLRGYDFRGHHGIPNDVFPRELAWP